MGKELDRGVLRSLGWDKAESVPQLLPKTRHLRKQIF